MTRPTRIGDACLYCGDCREILPTLGNVDAVVTDPPYGMVEKFGVQKSGKGGRRTLQFDWDLPDVTASVLDALSLTWLLCADRAGAFVFCGFDQIGRVAAGMRAAGFRAKAAVWIKKYPPPALRGNWWPSAFELACYGYRRGAYFDDRNPRRNNVFVADSYRHGQPGKVAHPTQKPLGLVSHIVASIVPPGGTCLDPFMGSGTAGIACAEHGRKFIGIEIDPQYFAAACKRISAFSASSAASAVSL